MHFVHLLTSFTTPPTAQPISPLLSLLVQTERGVEEVNGRASNDFQDWWEKEKVVLILDRACDDGRASTAVEGMWAR